MTVGTFVRVRSDHVNGARAGKDGMVMSQTSDGVALVFGWDRHNQSQHCQCVGPELWNLSELDLETAET